jgi:hypothetical protein
MVRTGIDAGAGIDPEAAGEVGVVPRVAAGAGAPLAGNPAVPVQAPAMAAIAIAASSSGRR